MAAVILDIILVMVIALYISVQLRQPKGKVVFQYLAFPLALVVIHEIGNTLQELEIGPEWAQYHLHNVGFTSVLALPIASLAVWLGEDDQQKKGASPEKAVRFVELLPFTFGATTVFCIALEVYMVTLNREAALRIGYSGALDIGDVVAYLIGFALVMVNHWILAPRVYRAFAPDADVC